MGDCNQIINSPNILKKSEAFLVRGKIYCDVGQEKRAIRDWEESVRMGPQVSVVWRNLGTAYSHQRRFRKAVRALKMAVALDPTDIHTLSHLGNVYVELGNDKEALFNHTKALKIAEMVQDNTGHGLKALYANRGFDYARLGQEHYAIQDCDQAVRLDPEDAFSDVNRALVCVLLGKDEEAQQDVDRAVALGMNRVALETSMEMQRGMSAL